MFLPDNIDFAESKKYILSIRLMPSGFYFSIHCPSDKTVFYQNSVSFSPNSDYLKNLEKIIPGKTDAIKTFYKQNKIKENDTDMIKLGNFLATI